MTAQGRAEALFLLDTYSVAGTVLRHIKESAEESMGCFQLNSYWPLKSPGGIRAASVYPWLSNQTCTHRLQPRAVNLQSGREGKPDHTA